MYPILIDVSKLTIVVIGGGKIASRKVANIVEAGGKPVVIAPEISPILEKYATQKQIIVCKRAYRTGDIQVAHLIFICTNDEKINQMIVEEAAAHQLVNDTTQQKNSNFFNMGFIKEDNIGLAVTTFGKSPKKNKQLKLELRQFLKEQQKKMEN